MTEDQAKKHLTEMLERFTLGSVLHLLADVQYEAAEQARLADEALAFDQAKRVEHTLFAVGLGLDAVMPS